MGAKTVCGLDVSVDMIRKAKNESEKLQGLSDSAEISFSVADCIKVHTTDKLPFKADHFDGAINHFVTGHCETKEGS